MTHLQVLAILRACGFRHHVRAEGRMVADGYGLGAGPAYRMWHPLLVSPGGDGSAYVWFEGNPRVDANGAVAECFSKTLCVAESGKVSGGPGEGSARWEGDQLSTLLDAMSRLRP